MDEQWYEGIHFLFSELFLLKDNFVLWLDVVLKRMVLQSLLFHYISGKERFDYPQYEVSVGQILSG